MSLYLIRDILHTDLLPLQGQMSLDAWIADQEIRADKVDLYRRYADGDHDGDLTSDMRQLLRISTRPGTTSPFNLNRCDNVIQTVNDRLELRDIEGGEEAAAPAAPPTTDGETPAPVQSALSQWVEMLRRHNRLDAAQLEIHEGALRDAISYVFVDWNAEAQTVEFIHEPAYDGVAGTLVLWEQRQRSQIACAIKVWHILSDRKANTGDSADISDTIRINVYYPNRIEKFISQGGTANSLRPYYDDDDPATVYEDEQGRQFIPWTMDGSENGEPIGVPLIPFINRGQPYSNDGRSELEDLIPIQDAANRLMYSMVLAAELTAFQNRVAIGFNPPSGLTPGAWITISPENPLQPDEKADAKVLEHGEVLPYIQALQFCIQQIDQISRTPNPETMGSSDSSGEALKQREIGLLGKVKRCQISFGNAWEDAFTMAARVQTAFGAEAPPAFDQLTAVWRDAEVRNQSQQVQDIMALKEVMGEDWAIEQVGQLYDMTEAQIQAVKDSKRAARVQNIQDFMTQSMNNYSGGARFAPSQNGNTTPQQALAQGA